MITDVSHSHYNRTGLLAATDSSLTFLPLSAFLDEGDIDSIIEIFDQSVADKTRSPIQAAQYAIQRDWLISGDVPQIELIMWSRGFINPVANESYITVLAGGLVCIAPFLRLSGFLLTHWFHSTTLCEALW